LVWFDVQKVTEQLQLEFPLHCLATPPFWGVRACCPFIFISDNCHRTNWSER